MTRLINKCRAAMRSSFLIVLSVLSVLPLIWSSAPVLAQSAAAKLEPVTLALDFIVLGRFAPWYVALAKGYYKQAGFDVTIVPSQGTAQSVQALESGIAQFAVSDLAGLVTTRAQGTSTAKMVAVVYQKSPYAIFSLAAGANVTQLKQLEGLEVASGAGSATPKIIQGMMAERGLNASKVTFTNVDGNARVALLLSGKIPAIETFILAKPGIDRGAGEGKVRSFLLADDGLELYSSGLLVKDAYLAASPDKARAFVKAAMQGWRDAMANPQEAAKLMHELVPTIPEQAIVAELAIVQGLAVTPDVKANGFGTIDPKKFEKGVAFLEKYAGISGKLPKASDLFSTSYLPNPAIRP